MWLEYSSIFLVTIQVYELSYGDAKAYQNIIAILPQQLCNDYKDAKRMNKAEIKYHVIRSVE